MNWRDYEKEIHEQFQEMYPDAEITHNTTLPGRYSKIDRQIDVLIEDYVAGDRIRIMVDGKYFSENIDVKEVECFIGMMQDVAADKGLLITQKGYSPAAIKRAHNDPSRIELDVLNFEELKQSQGFGALPYSGKHGVVMPSPFGWKSGVRHHFFGNFSASPSGIVFRVNLVGKKQSQPPFGCFTGCHKNRTHHSSSRLPSLSFKPLPSFRLNYTLSVEF